MTFQLIKVFGLITGQESNLAFITEMVLQIVITLIPVVTPLSIFFGAIYCTNKLCQRSEYMAMRSFGKSNLSIYKPILICTSIIALWIYAIGQNSIPSSKRNFRKVLGDLKSKSFLSELSSGQFFTEIPGVLLYAQNIDKKSFEMENVFIQYSKGDKKRTISAREGLLKFINSKEESSNNLIVDLEKGNIFNTQEETQNFEKIIFDKYTFNILGKNSTRDLKNKASAMNGHELSKFVTLDETKLEARGATIEDLYTAQLEFFNRLNTPLTCLILPLLGFCIGIAGHRGKSKSIAFSALFFLGIYYGIYFTCLGLAKKGTLHPFFSIFFPTAIISFFSYLNLRKVRWFS
jgi:lipopolysaccharide export system permease protein